ncbi:hypothetical protein ACFSTH_05710 [Paenibacillus yanchengensis]|uniref:Chromosome partitioning protein ParB n=1 Tax=Paenibacillus yanchengensis TaxID=2035833 RepID=A0ABW4YHJ4_9BACL
MKLFHLPERVKYVEFIGAEHTRWGNDAILFRVYKGLGKLATRYGRDHNGDLYQFLLLDNQPLITSYGEEIYCPTCAKILSLGLGRETVDPHLINTIKYSQHEMMDMRVTFENMKSMLTILEDGYYLLTRIEMIPTDGEGDFFWNLSSSRNRYTAAANVYYKYHVSDTTPKYLLPSQRTNSLNQARVDHYVAQNKRGKKMTGLAYYYDGFMSTLLDGHHRATAAYIENKTVDCLTIVKVTGLGFDEEAEANKLYAGGEVLTFDLFKEPQKIGKHINKTIVSNKLKISTRQVENIMEEFYSVWLDEPASIIHDYGKRVYPDYLYVGFADLVGDISKEHVDKVMSDSSANTEVEFQLEMIFKKIQVEEPSRAFELAKRIIHDSIWKVLHADAFRYLATLDRMEVEDIFIAYIVNTDYDSKDASRKIADEYLNNR